MNSMYVVELDVRSAGLNSDGTQFADSEIVGPQLAGPLDVGERLVEHVAGWLSWNADSTVTANDLRSSGRRTMTVAGPYETVRDVRWSVAGDGDVKVLQVTLTQELEGSNGSFVCETTVYRDSQAAALRIEMGRATVRGRLTPLPATYLRRPGLLTSVLRDASLVATASGQPVTGRYQFVDDRLAPAIPGVLTSRHRLPTLLVDNHLVPARDFSKAAARELAGLVQVVALSPWALRSLKESLAAIDADVPSGGARLVWPDLDARHPHFLSGQIASTQRAVNTLVRLVAPLSVAARGQNVLLRRGQQAARRAADENFRRSIELAEAEGDTAREVNALRARVADLSSENAGWISEVETLMAENAELRAGQAETQYWRETALAAQASRAAPSGARWDEAPECDSDDLQWPWRRWSSRRSE